jgi:membrane associated rhomboid family serine protease
LSEIEHFAADNLELPCRPTATEPKFQGVVCLKQRNGLSMLPLTTTVPVRFPPIATYTLIAINVVVFLLQISVPEQQQEALVYLYGLVPARYFHPGWAARAGLPPSDYLPFLTNIFMHGGWLHLVLNMWTLWLFGGAVEDRLGSWRYLAFYLLCGVAASAAHAFVNADSPVPALGASGAIAGVLGAYMRLFPLSNIVVLVPIIFIPLFFPLPAWLYIAFWFGMNLLQGTAASLQPDAGGVAWWAHIGGFVAGFLLVSIMSPSRRAYRPYYGDEGVLGFGARGERS